MPDNDWMHVDASLATSATLSDDGIIQEVKSQSKPQEEEDEDDPESLPQPTSSQVMHALSIVRLHFNHEADAAPFIDMVTKMEDQVQKSSYKKLKQSSIHSFFK
jgi:hypothetical protein